MNVSEAVNMTIQSPVTDRDIWDPDETDHTASSRSGHRTSATCNCERRSDEERWC